MFSLEPFFMEFKGLSQVSYLSSITISSKNPPPSSSTPFPFRWGQQTKKGIVDLQLESGSFTFSPVLSPLDQSKELTGHQWQSHLSLG